MLIGADQPMGRPHQSFDNIEWRSPAEAVGNDHQNKTLKGDKGANQFTRR